VTQSRDDILVAAAAIMDGGGSVLLTRRPDHVHQGGLWEFPGGKVEAGETSRAALRRELAEELGIETVDPRPLIRVRHAYADRTVVLDVYRLTAYRGQPRGLEGQAVAWVPIGQLADTAMPAADRPIVNALRLPPEYLISPPVPEDLASLLKGAERAIDQGIRLLQLRLRPPFPDRERAARAVARLCRERAVDLLVNGSVSLARDIDCGVHLTAGQLFELNTRPLAADRWVGASCHSPEELERARALGVDFALLSPVKATASHPEQVPLGWSTFAEWVQDLPLPVYALGGMNPSDLETAWRCGAQGVACIRGLWPD